MYEQLLALRCDNQAAALAGGLPAAHYTDPAHYELEKRRIFYRSWICVGHECMAKSTGSYFVAKVADQEVLVVRNRDGRLNAIHHAETTGAEDAEVALGVQRGMSSLGFERAQLLGTPQHGVSSEHVIKYFHDLVRTAVEVPR